MTCRVLHFHFGKEGGAERFFVNLARAFAKRGLEQRFIIRPNRTWDSEIAELGPVIRNSLGRLSPYSLVAHYQAKRIVKKWKPNAVMAWMPRAGRLIHDWPETIKLARMGDFPDRLNHFGNCDVLVGNNPGIAKRCRDLGWEKPITTITNFPRIVNSKKISRETLGTKKSSFIITACGRLVPRKGFHVLLESIVNLPNVVVWLLGDGQEKENLSNLAKSLGVTDRVKFFGWVQEPIHYIRSSDALVLPSQQETLGNSILEAWHSQVPTIATRTEGPKWFMRQNVDGILIDIDNVNQLSKAIEKLINDEKLRKSLVKNASTRLKEMFSEDSVVDAYIRLFKGDFGAE